MSDADAGRAPSSAAAAAAAAPAALGWLFSAQVVTARDGCPRACRLAGRPLGVGRPAMRGAEVVESIMLDVSVSKQHRARGSAGQTRRR